MMSRRLRGVALQGKNPSVRWGRLALNGLVLLAIIGLFAIGAAGNSRSPLTVNQAFSLGVQRATSGHLTAGAALEWTALLLGLASIQWMVLEFRAVLSGAIEIRPVDNASGSEVDTHPLDVAFREYMSLPKLYRLTTIPGDPEPEHLVEVLRVPTAAGWRGLAAAAVSYAFPRRAFIVSASLRKQDHNPRYGVTVQVRRLPGLATELETQWSTSYERALQRGAYAAVAHILPQTMACRNVPWSAWRRRILPASLFRDYQRAKKMVAERRYDEALNLYHRALVKDANNIDMRYDVGQLYERLGLYPDALYTYMNLVRQIFPHRPGPWAPLSARRLVRSRQDRSVIWYRYVVLLGLGAPLARELLHPDWPELREWLAQTGRPDVRRQGEERPLRTIELAEIRRLLADRLCELYPEHTHPTEAEVPFDRLLRDPCREEDLPQRMTELNRSLLRCAASEAIRLTRAMRWSAVLHLGVRRRSSLTVTAVRQIKVNIDHRLSQLDMPASADSNADRAPSPEVIDAALRDAGYKSERSANWLEHYNAACAYAFFISGDVADEEEYRPHAFAAVSALELALRYGEDIDFVRTKRYWLQAGDPDLAGLRLYTCFRAFETRVYGRPLPATVNIAKYELYLYLRAVLEDAAGQLEREWRRRTDSIVPGFKHEMFEEWWRQERLGWELAIRLGRFYRQWQTRREAVESRRNWIESFGKEARSIPYPHVDPPAYQLDIGDFRAIEQAMTQTEAIFAYLGHNCGDLIAQGDQSGWSNIMEKTRAWSDYAARCTQLISQRDLLRSDILLACESRAAVWAALRHWASAPSEERRDRFVSAVERLKRPPLITTGAQREDNL